LTEKYSEPFRDEIKVINDLPVSSAERYFSKKENEL